MEQINHYLVMMDREKVGREASPTLAIIDAQSVKCDAPQGERGYDAGKKVVGRKRHIAVDSDGRLLAVRILMRAFRIRLVGYTVGQVATPALPHISTR
ncbi:hypothetical protein CCP2SC5_90068 [Azospirillaceae bacterium]